MAEDRFPELIGSIIQNCGILEMLTNKAIERLVKDPLLSRKIVTRTFSHRIKRLCDLLHKRKTLPREDVDSFCKELSEIVPYRNVVAHNPIVTTGTLPGGSPDSCIEVVRYKLDPPIEKLTEADLQGLLERTRKAIKRFRNSVPEIFQL